MTSAKRFKRCREHLSLTQEKMGEIFGFKQYKIGDIETGKQRVTPEIAEKLEKKYFISGWWLLTGNGKMFLNDEKNNISQVNVNGNNIGINNGMITINTKDYNVNNNEIEELLELLKDVPSSWIRNIIKKLKKSIEAIDNDFK